MMMSTRRGTFPLLLLVSALLVAASESSVPRYWDIFPYVHWYYRYYAPRGAPAQRPRQYASLVDSTGKLRINSVREGQRPPEGKDGGNMVCYQCHSNNAYVYNMRKVAKTLHHPYAPAHERTKTVYVTRFQPSSERRSGWGECQNSFPHQVAGLSSIREVTCMGRCYVRVGQNREVSRGCLSPGHSVSRRRAGCYRVGGDQYCVCDGTRCNNQDPPSV